MRLFVWLGVVLACVASCGDNAPPPVDASTAAPEWPLTATVGRSAARVVGSADRVVWLEETIAGFDRYPPGPRRMRAVDRRSFSETVWEPVAPARIADAAVHPSGSVSVALVDDERRLTLVRLSRGLVVISTTRLVDPDIGGDPPMTPGMPPSELIVSIATAESVRLAAVGEDVVVAAMTAENSLIAYRMRMTDDGYAVAWRRLIEPAVSLQPFLPIGGSFDTFGAIVAWFRPSLAVDTAGNAYVALWGHRVRVTAHNREFGEMLAPLFSGPGENDSDILLSKIDSRGERQWTRVVGARYEDEPYAMAATDDRIAIAGRTRRNPGHDNSQWDPWLGVFEPTGAVIASRPMRFDAFGILLAVDLDDTGRIAAGGSDGWTQNPDGLSVLSDGHKLLFTLDTPDAAPVRIPLAIGPRHNELRHLDLTPEGIWFAGHEDGPLTHSGDTDPSQIHATGVVGFVPR